MTSRREAVILALKALVETALPFADVKRNRDRPTGIGPGGLVIIRDGDPGEPDVTMSPLAYTYVHRVPLEVAVEVDDPETRMERLDQMLTAIGTSLVADRTLGGLCDWLEGEAPTTDDAQDVGTDPIRWADVALVPTYTTSSPLT